MADIVWPEGLPAEFLRDTAEILPPNNFEESEMERGTKTRCIATGTPWSYKLPLHYKSTADYLIFENHILNTVKGQRFAFPDPDNQGQFLSCRARPQDGRLLIPERRAAGVRRATILMDVYK